MLCLVVAATLFALSCGASTDPLLLANSSRSRLRSQSHLTVSGTMPVGVVGTPFRASVTASGGTAPYRFAVTSGKLPVGLTLNGSTGVISGTPSTAGAYQFAITAFDPPLSLRGDRSFSIAVNASASVSVTVSPAGASVTSGALQQFTAGVRGTSNTAVTWAATAGTISSSGLFTAPKTAASESVVVMAKSVVAPSAQGSAQVSVTPPSPPAPAPVVSVTISPTSANLAPGATQQFIAAVSGTSNTAVTWSTSAGSISGSGLLTAPKITSTSTLVVRATSAADSTKSASATVTVAVSQNPGPSPNPGTVTVFPTSTTRVGHLSSEPLSAWDSSNRRAPAGTWSIQSGTGTVDANGIFTAPNADETDVVRFTCSGGSCSVTKTITVSGSLPSYSCAWNQGSGAAGDSVCKMTHDGITRIFYAHVPPNFVAGQSGLWLEFSGGDVDGLTFCYNAGQETYAPGRYVDSLPAPAPMVICPDPARASIPQWHSLDFDTVSCSRTWTFGGVTGFCPNDSDFARQIILAAKKDKNINLKAVAVDGMWMNGSSMAARVAIEQGDLIAVVGQKWMNLRNPKSTNSTSGPPSVPATNFPVSVISLMPTGNNASLLTVCGVNNNYNNFAYNYDDEWTYWNAVNQYGNVSSSASFCGGHYSYEKVTNTANPSGDFQNVWQKAGSLLSKRATGGLLNTAASFWVLNGAINQMYCSPGTPCAPVVHFASGACSGASPCNTTMDANTGDTVNDLFANFALSHPKP